MADLTETTSASDNETITELRNELRELNKSFKDSSRMEERLTKVMSVLATIQLLVAIIQFVESFAFSDNVRIIIWGTSMVIVISIILFSFTKKVSFK